MHSRIDLISHADLRIVNGRDYFRSKERELGIEGLDPASVQHRPSPSNLQRGPTQSRVGGRLTGNLKRLTSEETAERRERVEAFLSQAPTQFPADDAIAEGENAD